MMPSALMDQSCTNRAAELGHWSKVIDNSLYSGLYPIATWFRADKFSHQVSMFSLPLSNFCPHSINFFLCGYKYPACQIAGEQGLQLLYGKKGKILGSIDRWGVNGKKEGELWGLRGFSLNETRCVVGPEGGPLSKRVGGGYSGACV